MSNHEREAAVGMALARRAYLYSLFHVVFGGEPTEETLERLFGAESLDGLSAALSDDADGALDAFARKLSRVREDFDDDKAATASSLRSDYTALFEIPGAAYAHPWESSYIGDGKMVFQESTLDVRSFYHEAGFKLQAEKRFPDDHIAAMMDYLGRTGQRAYDAFADGLDADAARELARARRFIESHVLTWVDAFAEAVAEHDARGFYASAAQAMASFSRADAARAEELARDIESLSAEE